MRALSLIVLAVAIAPPLSAQDAMEADDELSELERLSRSQDDPFAGVIEQEQREPISVTLRALNKITARYTDIEIAMNEIAEFGSLEIQPRTCDKRPPEEFPETVAFLEVFDKDAGDKKSDFKVEPPPREEVEEIDAEPSQDEYEVIETPDQPFGASEDEAEEVDIFAAEESAEPAFGELPAPIVYEGPQAEGENIFRGWMFASSPALNALEHPVYDVWVIDCKTRVVDN